MAGRAAWEDPRLRAAWARRDWAAIFRRYRELTGLSQRQLEPLTGLDQPYVSKVESGKRRIEEAEVIDRIARGLQVPEELGGIPARSSELAEWMPTAELRARVARAHMLRRVDMGVADGIARVLATHRRTEDVVGGRAMWPVVRAQLDAVTAMLPDASGAQADELLRLAAEHAHWLSWVAEQEGKLGPALAWLDVAHGWAMEAGAYDLTSWVTRVRSHYTLGRDDPLRALRMAEAARHAPAELSPAAASIAAHAESMAAAAVGERDRAQRVADEALQLAERVAHEDDRPGWLYWLDPVRARLQRADVAYASGQWSDAASGYAAELEALEQAYPRDHAYYLTRMEDARARAS